MTRSTKRVAPPVGIAMAPASSLPLHKRIRLRLVTIKPFSRVTLTLVSAGVVGLASTSVAAHTQGLQNSQKHPHKQLRRQASADHHVGYASYYARKFFGRLMADGTPMRPESDNAASLTLPLGSKAMVTNLANGRTALVTIRDRGPFIKGRIIDVSPSTAKMLGILHVGIAKVAVIPLDKLNAEEKLDAIIAAADGSDTR